MKNYTRIALTVLVYMTAWACSEPDKIVSSSTEDGQFRLILDAEELSLIHISEPTRPY